MDTDPVTDLTRSIESSIWSAFKPWRDHPIAKSVLAALSNGVEPRPCANQTCGYDFIVQSGDTSSARKAGVLYCSDRCAKAEAQRQYRIRKKGDTAMQHSTDPFGARLQGARRLVGIDFREMGSLLKISSVRVGSWEFHGHDSIPDGYSEEAIAGLYSLATGVSEHWLLTGERPGGA